MSSQQVERLSLSVNDLLWSKICALTQAIYVRSNLTEDEVVEASIDFCLFVIEAPRVDQDLEVRGGIIGALGESLFPSEYLIRRLSGCSRNLAESAAKIRGHEEEVLKAFPKESLECFAKRKPATLTSDAAVSAIRHFPSLYAELGQPNLRSAYEGSGLSLALRSHRREFELNGTTLAAFRLACGRFAQADEWRETLIPVVEMVIRFLLVSLDVEQANSSSFREDLALGFLKFRSLSLKIEELVSHVEERIAAASALSKETRDRLLLMVSRVPTGYTLIESRHSWVGVQHRSVDYSESYEHMLDWL